MNLSNRITLNPYPYGCNAAIIIRDDDLNYFTPPEMIERIYEKAWKQKFKVSLSIIPRVKAIDDPLIPNIHRGKQTIHEVSRNKELIKYLKEKLFMHQIDIMQHGFTHEMIGKVPEFRIDDSHEIRKRLNYGRKILEDSFQTKIHVFIPPWDVISEQALRILEKEHLAVSKREEKSRSRLWMNLISSNFGRVLNDTFFSNSLKKLTPMLQKKEKYINLSEGQGNYSLIFNNGIKRKKIRIGVFDTTRKFTIEKGPVNGLFCILNHYHTFYKDWQDDIDMELMDRFYSLLELFNGPNVWRTTFTEVIDRIRKLSQVRVAVSKNNVIIRSDVNIEGLTIKGEDCILMPRNKDEVEVRQSENSSILIFNKMIKDERKEIRMD